MNKHIDLLSSKVMMHEASLIYQIFGTSPTHLYDILNQPQMNDSWKHKKESLEIYKQVYPEYAELIVKYQNSNLLDEEREELKAGLKKNAGRCFEAITEDQILSAIIVNDNGMLKKVIQDILPFLSEGTKTKFEHALNKSHDPATILIKQNQNLVTKIDYLEEQNQNLVTKIDHIESMLMQILNHNDNSGDTDILGEINNNFDEEALFGAN